MRKLFTAAFAIVLVTTLVSGSAWAKSGWDFQLYRTHVVNGTQLEKGSYELRLNGNNEAEIYRNRKLVTTVPVEVRPLKKGTDAKSMLTRKNGRAGNAGMRAFVYRLQNRLTKRLRGHVA